MALNRTRFTVMTFVFVMLSVVGARAQEDRSYILATATQGGTYYPVGVALATMVKVKVTPESGFSLSAINSAGSAENIRLMRGGEAQFALLQGIYGAWAWYGEGPLSEQGPQEHLRAVTALWPNVDHIVLRNRHVREGTLADLAKLGGAKFSIGRRNSGAIRTGREIFDRLGIDRGDAITEVYLGYGASADAIVNGTIAGFNMPGGVPVSAVSRALATRGEDLTLLEVSDQQLALLNARWPVWTRHVIAANTYPNQNTAVNSSAMVNFLAVRADVPAEDVYRLTRAIYENLPFLRSIHQATASMTKEKALEGLIMPLHEGAARYYGEAALKIPDRLAPPESDGS